MWDLPGPGLKLVSRALAGGFLITAPPGKSRGQVSCIAFSSVSVHCIQGFSIWFGHLSSGLQLGREQCSKWPHFENHLSREQVELSPIQLLAHHSPCRTDLWGLLSWGCDFSELCRAEVFPAESIPCVCISTWTWCLWTWLEVGHLLRADTGDGWTLWRKRWPHSPTRALAGSGKPGTVVYLKWNCPLCLQVHSYPS